MDIKQPVVTGTISYTNGVDNIRNGKDKRESALVIFKQTPHFQKRLPANKAASHTSFKKKGGFAFKNIIM